MSAQVESGSVWLQSSCAMVLVAVVSVYVKVGVSVSVPEKKQKKKKKEKPERTNEPKLSKSKGCSSLLCIYEFGWSSASSYDRYGT